MPQKKSKKSQHTRQKAICGEPNCGFTTRDPLKVAEHTRKYGHAFRTTIRK